MREQKKVFDLIMFGHHSWEMLVEQNFNSRNGQMLKYLNKSPEIGKIFYINPYFYSTNLLSFSKNLFCNCLGNLFSPLFLSKKQVEYPKITVVNCLNFASNRFFRKKFFSALKKKLETLGGISNQRILVWSYNPAEVEVFDLFPNARNIFDTVDNWEQMNLSVSLHPWYKKTKMENGYREICRRQEILIISNGVEMDQFYRKVHEGRENLLMVPNGVDTDFFSAKKITSHSKPPELRNCTQPLVGYVGVMQERFDLELFKFLVKANPDFTFVLVGKEFPFRDFNFDVCSKNVIKIGFKGYSEIPRYIDSFDVCIIPHKNDNMTRYMSPMKAYEYLAMGKRVVTTSLYGLEEIAEFCEIATDYSSFDVLLKEAVSLRKHFKKPLISNFSWKKRVEKILTYLNSEFRE
jgi:hypothetical protein